MAVQRRAAASRKGRRSSDRGVRTEGARAPEKKSVNIKLSPLVFVIAGVVLLIAAGVVAGISIAPLYKDVITQGVTINGVDVSGMTGEQALAALSPYAASSTGSVSAVISFEGRSWSFGPAELGATLDFTEAVNSAAAVARTGGLSQRSAEAKAALAGQYAFNVPVSINQDNLRYYLEGIKQELDAPSTEPTMAMQCAGPNYTVPGYGGYQPGVDYSSLFIVTPGSNGISVDVDATMNLLAEDLKGDNNANVGLVVNTQAAAATEQSLRSTVTLLYHSSSQLVGSTDNRNSNISLALSNFDGIVLAPDQVVSFNDTVGERTEARGYKKAKQIGANGVIESDFGGGICQAATTLFNAAINAGCEIIERNPHKWPLYFDDYGWGLDAMVDWGTSDLKFKNTTGSSLYLDFYFTYLNDKPAYVNIDIYGIPFEPGVTVKMESEKISEYPAPGPRYEYKNREEARTLSIPDDDWEYDVNVNKMTHVAVISRPGYVFKVYRVWYKDGAEFKRDELYTSEYPAIQGITYTKDAS